jgi:hypothetical protein
VSRRRIRSLKPEFFEDEKVCAISRDARLVTIGLITLADDRGRLAYRPLAILGDVFPEEAVSMRQLRTWLAEILEVGLALVYKVAANEYLWLPQFLRHQVINKPTESVLPAHPEDPWAHLPLVEALKVAKRTDSAGSSPVAVPDNSGSSPVGLPPHARSDPFPSVVGSTGGSVARKLIDEAVAILAARWEPDEVAVENCSAMYPDVDLLQGCRLAVTWASDPSWEIDSCAATLRAALRKLDAEKPKADEKGQRRNRRAEALAESIGATA